MDPDATPSANRRTVPITILAVIAALAVVKDLVDLFGKPADLQLANHDVQVWFGYRFEGLAAKIATFPHLLIYGFAAYGLYRMRQWGWWIAFIYLLYIPGSLVLYMIQHATGALWEIAFTAVSCLLIAIIVAYLYNHRHLFT